MELHYAERRTDWLTAQVVDEAILYLKNGGRPHLARAFLKESFVPVSVQTRVLTNSAVLRHLGPDDDDAPPSPQASPTKAR